MLSGAGITICAGIAACATAVIAGSPIFNSPTPLRQTLVETAARDPELPAIGPTLPVEIGSVEIVGLQVPETPGPLTGLDGPSELSDLFAPSPGPSAGFALRPVLTETWQAAASPAVAEGVAGKIKANMLTASISDKVRASVDILPPRRPSFTLRAPAVSETPAEPVPDVAEAPVPAVSVASAEAPAPTGLALPAWLDPFAATKAATAAAEAAGHALQSGLASWYGPRFNGRKTASGEIFNQRALTAAHRWLPFGTRVRVIDQTTGRSIVVRINDRGPYAHGRVIDLSQGSAEALGMHGLTRVKLVSAD